MFTYYFSLIPVYSFISYAHTLYAYALSLFLTHSLGCFLTTLDLHVQILNVSCYWSGVRWDWTCCEKLEFLYSFWYYYLPFSSSWFRSFPDSLYIAISRYSFSVFIWYHVWTSICNIPVILIYHSRLFYIACSDYFRLSVYTWGILLAYIHRRLSSRLLFMYFGKRGVTGAVAREGR